MKPLNLIDNCVNKFACNRCVTITLKTMVLVRTSLRTNLMRTVEQFNKNHPIRFLKLISVWAIIIFLVASCSKPSYANGVHPHGELALVGYNKSAHIVRSGLFLCVLSTRSRFMAKLEGEAFALASYLIYWSTNPFQLCHPYLVVNGKASVNKSGAH